MGVVPHEEHARHLTYVRLSDVRFARLNAKAHDIPGLAASLDRWGPVDLPVVDERTGELVAGNGRCEALIDLKGNACSPPDGVLVDDDGEWLIPVVRGWSSRDDDDARAAALTLNRLQEVGGYDRKVLAGELEVIATTDPEVFDWLGYSAEEVDALSRLILDSTRSAASLTVPDVDGGAEAETTGTGNVDSDDMPGDGPTPERDGTIGCPACGHRWRPKDSD